MLKDRQEIRLVDLAGRLQGKLSGPDSETVVIGISSLEKAGSSEVCYFGNPKYRKMLENTEALAVITEKVVKTSAKNIIIVPNSYIAFREALLIFSPDRSSGFRGISSTAVIHSTSVIEESVEIGNFTVVDRNCHIGKGSAIGSGCYIGPDVTVGEYCNIHHGVTLEAGTIVGCSVIIHTGSVLGSDGFGFVPDPEGHLKVPQNGIVIIEDNVEIGANCTIDRATVGETRIKAHAKLDNLVHIAHNVRIGYGCFLAAQVGIAGSTIIGDRVMLGGQVGIVGHLSIGDDVVVGAQAGVTKDCPAGIMISGYPARKHSEALKMEAYVSRLPDLIKRIEILEKAVSRNGEGGLDEPVAGNTE